MSLKESQVTKVSFMNEVASFIDRINTNKILEKNETCKKHKIQFLYYCQTCKLPICSDCCLMEKEHKTHEITKLNEIYQEHLNLVNEENKILDNKCSVLKQNLKDINEKLSELENFKYKKTKELNEVYETLKQNLEGHMQDLTIKLSSFHNDVLTKLTTLEKNKRNIEKEINESTQSELVSKSDMIVQNMKKINNEISDDKVLKNISLDLSQEIPSVIVPPYETAFFEIPNFPQYLSGNNKEKNKEIIYSPEQRINGLVWRIKLYPCGNAAAKGEYLSIFLELINGSNEPSKYYYKMEIINFSSKKNFSQEYSSNFVSGECWGYSKFYRLDRLEKEGFIEKQTGKIKVKIFIKPETYAQLCRDLKYYITHLEENAKGKDDDSIENEKNDSGIDLNGVNLCKSFEKKIRTMKFVNDFIIDEIGKSEEHNTSLSKKENQKTHSEKRIKKENDFALFTQNSEESLSKTERNQINDLAMNLKEKPKHNFSQIRNAFKYNYTEQNNKRQNDREILKKPKGLNAFQIDLSLDSDCDLKENVFVIPKNNSGNVSMSEDSYGFLMESLKSIEDKNAKKKESKFGIGGLGRVDGRIDYYNRNNPDTEIGNRYLNRYSPFYIYENKSKNDDPFNFEDSYKKYNYK